MPFQKIVLQQQTIQEISSTSVAESTNPLVSNYPKSFNVKDTMDVRGTFVCPSEAASNPVTQSLCSSSFTIERYCTAFKVTNFQAGSPGFADTACVSSDAPSSSQLPPFCGSDQTCVPPSNEENCILPPYFVYDVSGISYVGSEGGRTFGNGKCPSINPYREVIYNCATQPTGTRSIQSRSSGRWGNGGAQVPFESSLDCSDTELGGIVRFTSGNFPYTAQSYPIGSISGLFSCTTSSTEFRETSFSSGKSLILSDIDIPSESLTPGQLSENPSSPGVSFEFSITDIPLLDSQATGFSGSIGSVIGNDDVRLDSMGPSGGFYKIADLSFSSLQSFSAFPFSCSLSFFVDSTLISTSVVTIEAYAGSCQNSPCAQTISLSLRRYFYLPSNLLASYSTISGKRMHVSGNAKIVVHSFSGTAPTSVKYSATTSTLSTWAGCNPSAPASGCLEHAFSFTQSLSTIQLPKMCGRCTQYPAFVDDSNTNSPQACFESSANQIRTESQFTQQMLSTMVSYSSTFQKSHGGTTTAGTNFGCRKIGFSCSSGSDCCSTICNSGLSNLVLSQ